MSITWRYRTRSLLSVLLLIAIYSSPLQAATSIQPGDLPAGHTLINFESDPTSNVVSLGTLANGIWTSLGVTFDANDWVGDPPAGAFTITSPPNTLSGDNVNAFQPINASFDPFVTVVGAWGLDFELEAFDQTNNSLGSVAYTDGSPGLFGGNAEYAFIGLQSDVPIASAQFRRVFPNDGAFGFHIDDLVFVQVPEGLSIGMAITATSMLLCFNRKKRPWRSAMARGELKDQI